MEWLGAPLAVKSGGTGTNLPVASSNCRLVYSSSSQITLKPFNGNQIWIADSWVTIPSSGVNLANTGLTQSTLYYIYAYISSGNITLEASTTSHVTNTTYGHETKSGDATRTLVGMVYTDTGSPGVFVDTAAKRRVASWYNRPNRNLAGTFSTGSLTATSFTEINSANRVDFVGWADSIMDVSTTGSGSSNASQAYIATAFAIDSTTAAVGNGATSTSPAANNQQPVPVRYSALLSEGYHYITIVGQVQGGTTGTWSVGTFGTISNG
jgi:hypothetical protein